MGVGLRAFADDVANPVEGGDKDREDEKMDQYGADPGAKIRPEVGGLGAERGALAADHAGAIVGKDGGVPERWLVLLEELGLRGRDGLVHRFDALLDAVGLFGHVDLQGVEVLQIFI